MAEAITKTGQLTIRWLENSVNKHLNKLLNTEDSKILFWRVIPIQSMLLWVL